MAAELFACAVVGALLLLCGLIYLLTPCCGEAQLQQFYLNMRLSAGSGAVSLKFGLAASAEICAGRNP